MITSRIEAMSATEPQAESRARLREAEAAVDAQPSSLDSRQPPEAKSEARQSRGAKGMFVEDLTEGTDVDGIFLVQRKSSRRTKEGRPFLGLVLYDRSGVIDGQVWDDSQAFGVTFFERDFLHVRGVVDRYRERLQLRVVSCVRCRWEELSPDDFLPASSRPVTEMKSELRRRVQAIADPYLRALLERFEADAPLMTALTLAPAATAVHHDRLGGLLEHTLSIMALGEAVARVYPDLDLDLLMTGAFLHDLGKVLELHASPGFPYSDEGQLLGHIVLGYEIAMRKVDTIAGFPAELRMQVGHLVLSHQGEYEWGSPKRPKTLEAIVLHHLDNLDSKVDVFRKALGRSSSGPGEAAWTEYVRTLGRAIYRGGAGRRDRVRELATRRTTSDARPRPLDSPDSNVLAPDLFGDVG